MLGERKAARLARRAARKWWADRARRRLFTAAGDGDRTAMAALASLNNLSAGVVDAVWAEWIARPGKDLWATLAGWCRPASREPHRSLSILALDGTPLRLDLPEVRAAVIDVAARHNHPLAEPARHNLLGASDQGVIDDICEAATTRSELVGFCIEHGLTPADDVRRAAFFALTGQHDQHRAVDPDGSLLAAAYGAADEPERDRIQRAVLGHGDPDLVRTLVGTARRDRLTHMDREEINYLARSLADRHDYDELWRLITDVSVSQAVELVRLIGDWRPAGGTDRQLFHQLRATSSATLATIRRNLTMAARIEPGVDIHLEGISFAPDRDHVALTWNDYTNQETPGARVVGIFALPGGRLIEQYVNAAFAKAAHVGDAIIVAEQPGDLIRHSDGRREILAASGRFDGPVAVPGGFVVGTRNGLLMGGNENSGVRHIPKEHIGLNTIVLISSDPLSGRLAVITGPTRKSGPRFAVLDHNARLLARSSGSAPTFKTRVAVLGPDQFVSSHIDGNLRRWRLAGSTVDCEAAARVQSVDELVALPLRRQVATFQMPRPDRRKVVFVDVETLTVTETPPTIGTIRYQAPMAASPYGRYLAVDTGWSWNPKVEVHDLEGGLISEFLDRPVADMGPGDLQTILAAENAQPPVDTQANTAGTMGARICRTKRELLGLLHACLERRFGTDVELGTTAAPPGGPYDVELSREDDNAD